SKCVVPPNAGGGRVAAALPAPRAKPVADAGMLYTAQCQKPLPVGASGSKTLSANDFVPAGGFVQFTAGEMLPPVQPKPFRMNWVANVPETRSGLETVNTGTWALASMPPPPPPQPAMLSHPAMAAEETTSDRNGLEFMRCPFQSIMGTVAATVGLQRERSDDVRDGSSSVRRFHG